MSKKSRRRNKILAAGAALFGASKLMGKEGIAFARPKSGSADQMAADAKISEISDRNRGSANVGVASVKTAPPRGNPKSIYVQDDGSIQKGDKIYKDKEAYVNRNKSTTDTTEKKKTNIFGGMTKEQRAAKADETKARIKKFQEDKKNKSGAKKGKMMKLYAGGMAVSGRGQGIILVGKNKKTIIY